MKTYIIIGASSGIGKKVADDLASSGNKVIGTYNTHEIPRNIDNLSPVHLNVLDEASDYGFMPETIDGLLYCPGSINLKPFHRIKPEDYLTDYALNVVGAVKTINAALPGLKAAGTSSIVLISTVAVQQGFAFHAQVSASKGALEGLTRALAAEFAPAVRVNCIAPSLTDTPMAGRLLNTEEKKAANGERHPLKRVGETADIAATARFLLSDAASWVSGQVLHVDGGLSTLRV